MFLLLYFCLFGKHSLKGRKRRIPTLRIEATLEDYWEATLEKLPSDFFDSPEARMLESTPFKQGDPGYASIPLSHHNNSDVKRFWEINIETSAIQGRNREIYEGWVRMWGQYARLCVAGNVVKTSDLFREGALYKCFTNRDFLKMFLCYYGVRGRPGTVGRQAQQLNKFCNAAHSYFTTKRNTTDAGLITENSEVSFQTQRNYSSNHYLKILYFC